MRRSVRRLVLLAALLGSIALSQGAAPVPAAAQGVSPSFFGVIPIQQMQPGEIARAKSGGIGTLRLPVIWRFIEPNQDDAYDWSQLDYYVTEAARNGLEVLPFPYSSPAWAVDGCKGPTKCQSVPPLGSQRAREAWQDFLRDLVGRYGPNGLFWQENPGIPEQPITRWQVWNEPSSPTYWKTPNAAQYAELVRLSHDTITEVDPAAEVLLAGLFGSPQGKDAKRNIVWKYLGRFLKAQGISSFFDAIALHPYAADLGDLKRQLNKSRQKLVQAGDGGKEILVTEIGWGSARPQVDKRGEERPLIKGKQGQARLLKQAYRFLLGNRGKYNIGAVIWYAWKDPDHRIEGCEFCNTAGLFKEKGKAKPAWEAFVKVTGGKP
jgi:hypothetical protein